MTRLLLFEPSIHSFQLDKATALTPMELRTRNNVLIQHARPQHKTTNLIALGAASLVD
ncbi:hypothetical protein O9992_08555 [Vibrio lentus]|nr:hypothetical protein [Vibrio lentus]